MTGVTDITDICVVFGAYWSIQYSEYLGILSVIITCRARVLVDNWCG